VRELPLGDAPPGRRTLRDTRIRERFGITVVAIRRATGELLVNPSPETVLLPGDRVRVFGLPEQIQAFAAVLSASERE
jgi:voltage-gated potassium channel